MKKNLGALFLALVLGGAVFAENYTKGIDLQLGGSIGTTKMKREFSESGVSVEWTQNIFEGGGHFKVASYDCFFLNNMLGIYTGLGVNWGAFATDSDFSAKAGGISASVGSSSDREVDEHGFALSLEFMVGPAFGVDLGGVRFQTGLGFHGVFAWGWFFGRHDSDFGSSERGKVRYNAFGLALTPQFRFGASRRCSFLLGCDLTFDFPTKLSYEAGKYKMEIEFDKGFRFGAIPYIGLGINF